MPHVVTVSTWAQGSAASSVVTHHCASAWWSGIAHLSVRSYTYSKAWSCVASLFPSGKSAWQFTKIVIQQRELAKKDSIVAKRKSHNARSEIPMEHKWSARRTSWLGECWHLTLHLRDWMRSQRSSVRKGPLTNRNEGCGCGRKDDAPEEVMVAETSTKSEVTLRTILLHRKSEG